MSAGTGPAAEPAPQPQASEPELQAREHHLAVPRTARYYTVAGEGPVREVWILLHGFSMLARAFLGWFRPALRPGRLLVAPEALNRYYTDTRTRKVGATWMTSEDRLAEIADYVGYLDRLLAEVTAGLSPAPEVEVHGFSQGTATAARWVGLGTVRPRRLVLWAGGIPPDLDLSTAGPKFTAARLTLVVGDRDRYLGEEQVAGELARLRGAGIQPDVRRFQGGHVVPWPILEQLAGES